MYYYLMRKNTPLTTVEINERGQLEWWDRNDASDKELWPLEAAEDEHGRLNIWWEHRSVPIKQGQIAKMLEEKQLSCPEEYLVKNLGLSLTDYYWVKPVNSALSWADVNLFDNPFQNEMVIHDYEQDSKVYGEYTPNSSLQGQLEKKWGIIDGERYLVKGNKDNFSAESINEVIASKLHEMQGHSNYVSYSLYKVKNRSYDYGCISKMFTSKALELVSAYSVVTSEKKSNDVSSYEHFIKLCAEHGMDEEVLRRELEYQIQTDFILSNRDRHLSNLGMLRNADTLRFEQMAPIFDSGKSLFLRQDIPETDKAILSIKTESFASSELGLLSYVRDRSLVDISKLPGREVLKDLYSYDSQMSAKRIDAICDAYERKIELYSRFQRGENIRLSMISNVV